jgi:phospholipid/cholesterol/gamma-HCH transport system substrate-binding protein
MENKAYALGAGLFTLLLLVGVLATAVWFSGEAVETSDYLLVSRYPVTGLNVQAPVRYRGVQVGKVESVAFDPLESRAILVTISVRAGTPLTQGTYAQLGSQGVTGLSYVILDDDGSKPGLLVADAGGLPRIDVRPSFMDTLTSSGQELVTTAGAVAKRLDKLLDEKNQAQLMRTLTTVEQASDHLARLADQAAPAVKALPAVIQDAGVALKRADALLANLNQRVEAVEGAARGIEQMGVAGAALSETLMNDSLPRLNVLVDDLQRSSRTLDRLLDQISDQPSSLVFGRGPAAPGPGETGYKAPAPDGAR